MGKDKKEKKDKGSKSAQVIIRALDQTQQFTVQDDMKVKDFQQEVFQRFGIRETWYYGLEFLNKKNALVFAKPDKKMKDLLEKNPKGENAEFNLKIRAFPPSLDNVYEANTINMLMKQAHAHYVAGDFVPSDQSKTTALAALAASFFSQGGQPTGGQAGFLRSFLPKAFKGDSSVLEHGISYLLKSFSGMSREQSAYEYLKVAESMPGFGTNFYEVVSDAGRPQLLGVSPKGIALHEKRQEPPKEFYPWGGQANGVEKVKVDDEMVKIKLADKNEKLFKLGEKNEKGKSFKKLEKQCEDALSLYKAMSGKGKEQGPQGSVIQQLMAEQASRRQSWRSFDLASLLAGLSSIYQFQPHQVQHQPTEPLPPSGGGMGFAPMQVAAQMSNMGMGFQTPQDPNFIGGFGVQQGQGGQAQAQAHSPAAPAALDSIGWIMPPK